MKRSSSVRPHLKHLAFFEAIGGAVEGSSAERSAAAGLLLLRLIDHWTVVGSVIVEPESVSIRSVRNAIMEIPSTDPQRDVLLGLVNTLQTLREVDLQPTLPRLFAFAQLLERRNTLALAADVYDTILGYGNEHYDADLMIDAYMRMGYCQRVLGDLNEAERAYTAAGKMAKRSHAIGRVLRSRIGLAVVATTRGNLPKADEMLREIAAEGEAAGLLPEQASALHARSVVALRQRRMTDAVCLAYDALEMTEALSERERILADLGASFIVMERFAEARDALLVLEATATTETVLENSRVNLVALAARSGDRKLFAEMRRLLHNVELPSEVRVNFLIESARGFRIFGEPGAAIDLLTLARDIALEHGLNRSVFEAEGMLAERTETVTTKTSGEFRIAEPDPAAHVAAGLRAMAEAIAA